MRLLHAIHDYLPAHRSGSEIYAHALARAQRERGHEVAVLCAEWDPALPTGTVCKRSLDGIAVHELINNWDVPSLGEGSAPGALARPIHDLLGRFRPEVVHVHNLLNLSFDLPAMARREGAGVVATLHDYTLFCASGGQRVHVAERHVCHEIDAERCARCFRQTGFYRGMAASEAAAHPISSLVDRLLGRRGRGPKVDAGDLELRLERARAAAKEIDWFVSPSRALAADAIRFGLDPARVEVSDYGFPRLLDARRAPGDGRLRVGFVGTLVWHKGAHVLLEALRRLPPQSFVARLHGVLDWYPDYVRDLRALAHGMPIEFSGGFGAAETAEVFAGIDVLVVPSLWPENSPLVVHEAFQAGVPVVGARTGGIPELIADGVSGSLYRPESPEELAAALLELVEDPGRLARFAAALPPVKSIEQDATEWEERYRRLRRESPKR